MTPIYIQVSDFEPQLSQHLSTLAEIAPLIWQRGWAEANAGNVSIRLSEVGKDPNAAIYYLVSRTGTRYRQFASNPMQNMMIIQVQNGEWQAVDESLKPTSEWDAHLAIHQHLIHTKSPAKVVLHSHPNSVIAISHHEICKDVMRLNKELAEMLPELPLYMPKSVSICPHLPPGSQALADASGACLHDTNAIIWLKHGLLCMGETLDQAFDYMEIIDKACDIWLQLARSSPR